MLEKTLKKEHSETWSVKNKECKESSEKKLGSREIESAKKIQRENLKSVKKLKV